MAKPRKNTAVPEPVPMPQVGDKVYPPRSEMVYEISKVHHGGEEVDLHVPALRTGRICGQRGTTMTLVTIGDYTFNPEAIDLVKGDREDYCEVFFRNGQR
jgi:hypothetical protein